MREVISIAAEARSRAGKGTARATRLKLRVPAVIYGGKEPPVIISIDSKELLAYLESLAPYRFFSVSAAGDSLAELRWDSESTREPADVLACVSDDCGIGTVARKLRRWSLCRKIERASLPGGSLGEDAGSRSSLG